MWPLTQALLERIEDGRLFAIEKDERMVQILKELFQAEQLTLIHRDVLDIDWPEFLLRMLYWINQSNWQPIFLIIYYYYHGPIGGQGSGREVCFHGQKEVAERMVAKTRRKGLWA